MICSTTQQSAQQQRARCASLTAKGLPCKARRYQAWIPFCHCHVPLGPAEFVGGGPLDGLFFVEGSRLWRPREIVIGRVRGGRVVMCSPRTGAWGATLGTYRQAFHGLVLVWQWEAAAAANGGSRL